MTAGAPPSSVLPPRGAPRPASGPLFGALLLGLGGAGGCTIYGDCPVVYEPTAVVVEEEPPAVWERIDDRPPRPVADAAWVDGYWDWDGAQWVWVDGHWETGRSGQVWTEPRAVRTQGGVEYHPGYWRPEDTPPSGVYRRDSDVRVSARGSVRVDASARVGGGSGSGGSRVVRTGSRGGGDGVAEDDGQGRRRGTVRPVRPSEGDGRGGGDDGNDVDTGSPGRPARGSTSGGRSVGRGRLEPDPRGQEEETDRRPTAGASRGQTPTAGASRGETPVMGARQGRAPTATARGEETRPAQGTTAGGSPGSGAPVVDEGGAGDGELRCSFPIGVTNSYGVVEAVLENAGSVPRFMSAQPLPVIARQGDSWERVRLRVPLSEGTWSVVVTLDDGRSAECGYLRVIEIRGR
jgi:hypothetical protein